MKGQTRGGLPTHGAQFSPKEKGNSNTCYNVDELSRKKPDIKGQILYDSIYTRCTGQANPKCQQGDGGCQGLGKEGSSNCHCFVARTFPRRGEAIEKGAGGS